MAVGLLAAGFFLCFVSFIVVLAFQNITKKIVHVRRRFDLFMVVPLLQFFFVYVSLVAPISLCLVFVCSSFLLLSIAQEC